MNDKVLQRKHYVRFVKYFKNGIFSSINFTSTQRLIYNNSDIGSTRLIKTYLQPFRLYIFEDYAPSFLMINLVPRLPRAETEGSEIYEEN